ncbi:MAG TPA: PTS sugar transporter subunit IIA [Fusobacterium ulcerans]|jgi:PTS system nitrogen regulatory IIA component|nr:PTS sugar transporter subunit IIA [Fusobacterium ulcerans]
MMLKYFNNKLITTIEGKHSKEEVLQILVNLIRENSDILDNETDFYDNILAREKVGSTGIGMGIALPHARCENIKQIVVAVGLLKESIDFNSLDGENVKLVVLVGAPKKSTKEYLSLVSDLMRAFRNPKTRTSIFEAGDKQELIGILAELKK